MAKQQVTLSAIAPLIKDGTLSYEDAVAKFDIVNDSAGAIAQQTAASGAMPAPPTPPPDHGVLMDTLLGTGRTIKDYYTGLVKGGVDTAYNLGKLTTGAATGDFGAFDPIHGPNEITDFVEPVGAAQHVGKTVEKVAEFFVPGGAVTRGAKAAAVGADVVAGSGRVLAEIPGIETLLRGGKALTDLTRGGRALEAGAKLGARAGLEGASAAGVTAAQTGGDPGAATAAGGTAAAVTGVLGASGIALTAAASAVTAERVVKLATEFGIPLTRAQQLQSRIMGAMDWVARRSLGGAKTMAEFDLKQNDAIKKAGQEILSTMSSAVKDDVSAGLFIKASIDHANDVNSNSYSQVLDPIIQQAGDVPLDVKGPLRTVAKELLADFKNATQFSSGVSGTEDVSKAMQILQDFAEPYKAAAPVAKLVGSAPVPPAKAGRTLAEVWSEYTAARKATFEANDFIHKAEKKLGHAISPEEASSPDFRRAWAKENSAIPQTMSKKEQERTWNEGYAKWKKVWDHEQQLGKELDAVAARDAAGGAAAGTAPQPPTAPATPARELKTLTIEQAWQMRKLLNKMAYSGTDPISTTMGKGALQKITGGLTDAIDTALRTAGRVDLAQHFAQASSRFAKTKGLLENSMIQTMLKRGKNSPETVLSLLEGSSAETAATTLRQLIHKTPMREVEAALWRRMLEPPVENPEGILMGRRLKQTLDGLSNGAKRAIFPDSQRLAKIERFAELADKAAVMSGVGSSTAARAAGGAGTLMAYGQMAAIGTAGGFAIKNIMSQDSDGRFWVNLGTGAAVLIAPAVLAKLLTRPGATDTLISALSTDARSTIGRQLAARISAWIGGGIGASKAAPQPQPQGVMPISRLHPPSLFDGGGQTIGAAAPISTASPVAAAPHPSISRAKATAVATPAPSQATAIPKPPTLIVAPPTSTLSATPATATSNDLTKAEPELKHKISGIMALFQKEHPGYKVIVNDVTRSAADQAAAFKAGYSTVDGKTSIGKHNYKQSMAADLNIRDSKGNMPSRTVLHSLYLALGELAEDHGLRWGGRWSVPYDPYHFELPQRGALSPPQATGVRHVAETGDGVQFSRSDGVVQTGTLEQVIDPSQLPDGTPNGKPTYIVRSNNPRRGEKLIVVPEAQIKPARRGAVAAGGG